MKIILLSALIPKQGKYGHNNLMYGRLMLNIVLEKNKKYKIFFEKGEFIIDSVSEVSLKKRYFRCSPLDARCVAICMLTHKRIRSIHIP